MDLEDQLQIFARELYLISAIKFGEFKTKIGLMTPVYCDLRVIVSYPKLLEMLTNLLLNYYREINKFDILCGVPYTALPIATAISLKTLKPMVLRRKETKNYGTKKIIEGAFKKGNRCLIIEDVVTSGSSILETVKDLNDAGILCSDAVVLLNREQGGQQFLQMNGIKMHALFTLRQLLGYLKAEHCVDDNLVDQVEKYLSTTQVDFSTEMKVAGNDRLKLSFESRLKFATNVMTTELMTIMISKRTNLCVAADLTNSTALLNLAEQVGPYICALKTHIDIIDDFHPNLIVPLKEIAKRHNFLLLEDRKFSDIGNTVEYQFSKGIYRISSWANLVTVHSLMGKGVLDAINVGKGVENKGVFLLAEASSADNLITEDYVQNTLKMAQEYPKLITGIVCQKPLFRNNPGMLQLTPGVRIDSKQDHLGQRYNKPEYIISQMGADIAVVGRGITNAEVPHDMAIKYQKVLWNAYLKRIQKN